jgi:uncharacterized membrane protein YbhN (UPF0104 family)
MSSLPAPTTSPLRRRFDAFSEALLAQAQTDGAAGSMLAAPSRLAPRVDRRKLGIAVLLVLGVLAVLSFTNGPADKLTDAFTRVAHADLGWVLAGVAFEALSFAGYIALFWLIASNASVSVRLRESAEISLAGAAATRLLPTAGLGGVALTLWALARSGLKPRAAVQTLLVFLVLLYTVFMGGLAVAGLLLATGAVAGDGPFVLMTVPAVFGIGVITAALVLGHRRATVFGPAVRSAIGVVRRGDPRLLGAIAWWGFDLALLAAMFQALGAPPAAAVLVLAYFTGAIGNTIPLPGLVAGGSTGVLLAFGVDAAVALPAVLAYRAVALWVPAALGAAALTSLRRTAARWAAEREGLAAPAAEPRFTRRPELRVPCPDPLPA